MSSAISSTARFYDSAWKKAMSLLGRTIPEPPPTKPEGGNGSGDPVH
ncbi:MAG: hypothetical protein QM820_30220 [Minicystis sp.]